jgi:hypothetical protein
LCCFQDIVFQKSYVDIARGNKEKDEVGDRISKGQDPRLYGQVLQWGLW